MESNWDTLEMIAAAEVEFILARLPAALRQRAAPLPVTFQKAPNAAQSQDGIEPDTLGLFVGSEYEFQETGPLPLPPQIILFLTNIWEFAEGQEEVFRKEVRTTYLHELGHYLGLDEEQLFDRGLE